MSEKLDLTQQKWILPYKLIEKTLKRRGSVTVRVSTEGEAFDVQVWAKHRGYKIAKVTRYTGGIEIDLEVVREVEPEEEKELAVARLRPTPASLKTGPDIEAASRYLAEPVFRADLILEGKSTSNLRFTAPTSLREIVEEAVKTAGEDCAVVSFRRLGDLDHADMVICNDGVQAAYVESKGSRLFGSKALEGLEEVLSKLEGSHIATVTIVGRSFVERIQGRA